MSAVDSSLAFRVAIVATVLAVALVRGTTSQAADPLALDQVTALKFDPAGKRLAIGRMNGSVELWDRGSGKRLWNTAATNRAIYGLFFRDDGRQLVATEALGNIRSYAVDSPDKSRTIVPRFLVFVESEEEPLTATALDPTGRYLAVTGAFTSLVYLIDMDAAPAKPLWEVLLSEWVMRRTKEGVSTAIIHGKGMSPAVVAAFDYSEDASMGETLTDLGFCSSGRYVAATTTNGVVVVWDRESTNGRASKTDFFRQPKYTRKIGSSRDRYRALLGLGCTDNNLLMTIGYYSKYGQIQLWKTEQGTLAKAMTDSTGPLHPDPGRGAIIDSTGRFVITTGGIRYILWKLSGGELHPVAKLHYGRRVNSHVMYNTADFTPGARGAAVAVGSDVFLVDIESLTSTTMVGDQKATLNIDRF